MRDNKRFSPPEPEDILEKNHPLFMDKKAESVTATTSNLNRAEYQVDDNVASSKGTWLRGGMIILIMIMGGVWFFWPQISASLASLTGLNLVKVNTTVSDQAVIDDRVVNNNDVKIDEVALDSDKDGLSNSEEESLGLDINKPDTDGDKLSDKDEVKIYLTDPFKVDADGDGFTDGEEVKYGFDPNGPGKLNDIFKVISK